MKHIELPRRLAVFPLALAIASITLPAASLNFTGLTQAGLGFNSVGSAYTQDGYSFSAVSGGFGATLGAFQTESPDHPAGGSPATSLTAFYALTTVTIAPASGQFDLASIDLSEYGADQGGGTGSFTQTFIGTQAGGATVNETFTINRSAIPTLSTFDFTGFSDLTSVSFVQGTFRLGTGIQFDNLVVNPATTASAPEPSTLTATIFGIGVFFVWVGTRYRRRCGGKDLQCRPE